MENLIYILLGILWVAYSLYSARQKAIAKQQSQGLPPPGPSHSSPLPIPGNQSGGKSLLEEIFRELTSETRPVPQVKQTVFSPKPESKKYASEIDVAYEGHSGYKYIQDIPSDFNRSEQTNDLKTYATYEQSTNNESISKNFNLRDAVIFSELLNRKYF